MIKTRVAVGITILGMMAVLFGGCVPAAPSFGPAEKTPELEYQSGFGTVEVYVTDAPPDKEVTAILLAVSSLKIHKASTEQEQEQSGSGNATQQQSGSENMTQGQEGEGEWITIDILDDMTTFDLLQIKGIEEFFGSAEVQAGKYTQMRLVVEKAEVALGDEAPQEARLPSGELKIVRPFNIIAGEVTTLVLDFDAEHSVVVTGSGKIQVKPVVKLSIEHKGQSGISDNVTVSEE